MKKFVSALTALFITASLSISSFAADVSSDTQQVIENNIVSDINADLSGFASEAKDDAVNKSDAKSFKGKFANLFVELNSLRSECKDLWTGIKTSSQNIKSEWKALKESLKGKDKTEVKKTLSELKAELEPLRTQVKALYSDIKNLRTQKTAEWANFRAAVKARDESKASTSLSNIINLKSQIIEKQKLILEKKQEILGLIKS